MKLALVTKPDLETEDNKELMMSFGQNLLEHIDYTSRYGFMYYKSDKQTFLGTRATGNKRNSQYKIAVPRSSDQCHEKSRQESSECPVSKLTRQKKLDYVLRAYGAAGPPSSDED